MEYWRSHLIENENLLVASEIGEEPMATPLCELCNKNERYHICTESNNQHLCLTCFNKLHFGIKCSCFLLFFSQYIGLVRIQNILVYNAVGFEPCW